MTYKEHDKPDEEKPPFDSTVPPMTIGAQLQPESHVSGSSALYVIQVELIALDDTSRDCKHQYYNPDVDSGLCACTRPGCRYIRHPTFRRGSDNGGWKAFIFSTMISQS